MNIILTDKESLVIDAITSHEDGTTSAELGKELGFTVPQVQQAMHRIKKRCKKMGWQYPITSSRVGYKTLYFIRTERERYGERLFNKVSDLSEVLKEKLPAEGYVWLGEFKGPTAIVILADSHLGLAAARYPYTKWVFEQVGKTPNCYLFLIGDIIDNSLNTKAPDDAIDLVAKSEQLDMVTYLLGLCKRKLLCLWEGNHEARSYISDHFDISGHIAQTYSETKYGWYGEPAALRVGDHLTRIYARHKGKGHSQYHPFQAGFRAVLFDNAERARDCDILIHAHTHNPGVCQSKVGGLQRLIINAGCAVQRDNYAERVGFASGSGSDDGHVLIIMPSGKRLAIQGIELGLMAFNGIQEVYKHGQKRTR